MRITLPRILPFLICFLLAAPAAAEDDNFSGRYEGRIGDTPATLDLRVSGSMVSGRITRADSASIELNGTSDEGRIVGAATTVRGRARGPPDGAGPRSSSPADGAPQSLPAGESSRSEEMVSDKDKRDHHLVGTWIMRGLGRRGDMVLPVTTTMTLDADGGYAASSEPPDESKKGEWRSRDGLLDYRPENGRAWSELGAYRLHGDRLIVILPGNEAQVWTRGH